MVLMSRPLEKRSKIMGATKRIVNYSNAGFYQVLSAETGTKHGLNVSGLVFDEIHAQPNRHLYDVLTKGSGDAPINFESLKGRECYAGLDLSSTSDITAFVLVFPPRNELENYIILPYFWLPKDTLELRCRRNHVLYDVWERQGYLKTTEGNVVH